MDAVPFLFEDQDFRDEPLSGKTEVKGLQNTSTALGGSETASLYTRGSETDLLHSGGSETALLYNGGSRILIITTESLSSRILRITAT